MKGLHNTYGTAALRERVRSRNAAAPVLCLLALLVALLVSYILALPVETTTSAVAFTCENSDLAARVELPEGSGVPLDAQLRVAPVTADAAVVADLEQQVLDALGSPDPSLTNVTLYDISFYTPDGDYIPVSDSASVFLAFKQPAASAASDVQVLHFEDDVAAPTVLDQVEASQDDDGAVTSVGFDTEGFSVFALVEVLATQPMGYVEHVVSDLDEIDGRSYIVTSNKGSNPAPKYALSDEVKSPGLKKITISTAGFAACPMWTFSKTDDGSAWHMETGGKYLTITGGSKNNIGVTDDASQATDLEIVLHNDMLVIGYNGRYLNNWGTDSNSSYWAAWTSGTGDTGSHVSLYAYTQVPPEDGQVLVTDLDGRSYAVVSQDISGALSTTAATVGTFPALGSTEVSLSVDGSYVLGDPVPEWFFEAVTDDTDGLYYVYTLVDDARRYLRLLDAQDATDPGTGSLGLGDAGQPVTVTAADDGLVRLSVEADDGTPGYVTFDSASSAFTVSADRDAALLHLSAPRGNALLYYNINYPSLKTVRDNKKWKGETPAIPSTSQEVAAGMGTLLKPSSSFSELGAAGTLYKEKHPDVADEDNPYYGMYRMSLRACDNLVPDNKPTQFMDEEEYLFYWTYTDHEGMKHRFKPDAPVEAVNPDSSIRLTDICGQQVSVPPFTTLEGEWVQASSPIFFFINHKGTILDTEGDVAGRNQASFLNGTAIGHVFFGTTKVGQDGTFALAVNETITAMFRSKGLIDLEVGDTFPETQVLITTATAATGENLALKNDESYGEANASILLEATLSWIKDKSDVDLYISTGNGLTRANNDLLTTDNYSIRWYVAKEEGDGWHIDGVITARTKSLKVTKTFNGLSDDEITRMLPNYLVSLRIRNNAAGSNYMVLDTTTGGIDGQYVYNGYDAATRTASWTVNLLVDEHVTVEEDGYAVDGYACSIHSVIDGAASSAYSGAIAGYEIAQARGSRAYDIVGGTNSEVAFTNTYTEIGKGTLSLLKRNTSTGQVMQNVTFTLSPDDGGDPLTAVTDAAGRADFTNLEAGTYRLVESTPTGFVTDLPAQVHIVVTVPEEGGSATVSVYEDGSQVASGTGSVFYTADNTPYEGSVIIEKVFRDIKPSEVAALASYRIDLDRDGTSEAVLTLDGSLEGSIAPIYRSADGLRYTWLVENAASARYTVTESGYASESYTDTSVSARLTVGDTVIELGDDAVAKTANTAQVVVNTDPNAVNRVVLTNTYTDTFVLYLMKTDTVTGQPLKGAVFELYGSYEEATDAKKTVQYRASDGSVQTLYYIGQTNPSNANGLAAVPGLNLSSDGQTYAYVLSEIIAPDGYAKPEYPDGLVPSDQVITVTVDDIANNVFTTEMVNQTIGSTLYVTKEVPDGELEGQGPFDITVTLEAPSASLRQSNRTFFYHVLDASGAELSMSSATGSQPVKSESPVPNIDTCTFAVSLEAGQTLKVDDVPVNYSYTVSEAQSGAYSTVMANANKTGYFDNNLSTVHGSILDSTDDEALNTVTVTNSEQSAQTTTVTVLKSWKPADLGDGQTVDVSLYRIKDGDTADAALVDTRTLSAGSEVPWATTWPDLPLYDEATGAAYDYLVAETVSGAYWPTYSTPQAAVTCNGETLDAAYATGSDLTVTNSTTFEIPATGGLGTTAPLAAGAALLAATLYASSCRTRQKRGEVS